MTDQPPPQLPLGTLGTTREPPPVRVVRAIGLTAEHLNHQVSVTDYAGKQTLGVLHRIELSAGLQTRVVVRVATRESTESGGHYWSTFGAERYLNRDALVYVGEPVPDRRPE